MQNILTKFTFVFWPDTGDISCGPGNRGPFGRRWRSGSQCSVHSLCRRTASSSTGVCGADWMKAWRKEFNVCSVIFACMSLIFLYLSFYRLSSRTLSVMEAVQRGKQWGERHALPTSQLQLSVTVQLSQCRPRLIRPSHRLEVSFTCQSPKEVFAIAQCLLKWPILPVYMQINNSAMQVGCI